MTRKAVAARAVHHLARFGKFDSSDSLYQRLELAKATDHGPKLLCPSFATFIFAKAGLEFRLTLISFSLKTKQRGFVAEVGIRYQISFV